MNNLTVIASLLALAVLAFAGQVWFGWREGRRHRLRRADEVLAVDDRAPIVYLRPFSSDESREGLNPHTGDRREALLGAVVSEIGPFIAIGRPGEPVPPHGAARLYVDDDHWQAAVVALLARAHCVIVAVGDGIGLRWELDQVLGQVAPERVLVLPPTFDADEWRMRVQRGRIEARWRAFKAQVDPRLPAALPERVVGVEFLQFDAGFRPSVVPVLPWWYLPVFGIGRRTRSGYTEALRPFFARLGRPLSRRRFWIHAAIFFPCLGLLQFQVVFWLCLAGALAIGHWWTSGA